MLQQQHNSDLYLDYMYAGRGRTPPDGAQPAEKEGKSACKPIGKWGLVPRRVSRKPRQLYTPPLALQILLLPQYA